MFTPLRRLPANITPAVQARLRDAALRTTQDAAIPAHAHLLDFMREEYMPRARDSLAASALPDGAAYYQAQIRKFTALELSPEAIHACGLAEVEKLHAEMHRTIHDTGFAGDFVAFQHHLVLCAGRRRTAQAGCVDRQPRQRRDRTLHRPPAPPAPRNPAGAGRADAQLHPWPRRRGLLPGQHLEPALASALCSHRAGHARGRARPRAADAAGRRARGYSRLPPPRAELCLQRRLGAVCRMRVGRALRHPRLPRCRARHWLGAAAGARTCDQALHRRGGHSPWAAAR